MPHSPIQRQKLFSLFLTLYFLALSMAPSMADVLAAWDVSGQTNYGTSPLAPTTVNTNVDSGGLVRGSSVVTPATGAAGRAWGGLGWNYTTATDAITNNRFATFSVSAKAGFNMSISTIDRLDYRRSGTGATTGVLQYQIGSGSFVDIQTLNYQVSTSGGATLGPFDLSAIGDLQNLAPGTVVTFRLVNFAASASGGTWYLYDFGNSTAADLSISGTTVPEGLLPPTITGFSPSSGAAGTAVTITGTNFGLTPTVKFNGVTASGAETNLEGTSIMVNVPAGATTGPISVTAAGTATSATSFTVIVPPSLTLTLAQPSVLESAGSAATTGFVTLSEAPAAPLIVTITSGDVTEATVPATITVDAGELTSSPFDIAAVNDGVFDADIPVTITASAAGYTTGSATLTVQNVNSPATTVVVNKYLNGSPDMIELLVIAAGTPNSVTSLQGMIIKDHSSNMVNDGGGKFSFNAVTLFAEVKAGTLITLSNSATSADTDAADFKLSLGLLDTTYFTSLGGSFDISTTDMVSIKASGALSTGAVGTIHTLAGGTEGALFTSMPGPKLIATGTSGTGLGVIANNTTSVLADFSGTDATGAVTLSVANFGSANNLTNNTYIRQLRGTTSLDGLGVVSVVNGNALSALQGKNIFPRNSTGQTLLLSVIADAAPGLIEALRFTVPTEFGMPLLANISVGGAGAGTPVVDVVGQQVTVTGLAVNTTDAVEITLSGLSTPNPIALTDDGRYSFPTLTAGSAGTLTAVSASPVALVTIPIANLRDVNAQGVPLDAGKVVAIQGVCTMESFASGTSTTAYFQDGNFGVSVFSPTILSLTRNSEYATTGQVGQFNGVTQVAVPSMSNFVDLGASTPPTPLTITVADLALNYEAYEGRLIRIVGLTVAPSNTGIWGSGATVIHQDSLANLVDVRINTLSTAPAPTAYPAAITGILGQFDNATPFTIGYQIMPRDAADIESAPPVTFASWIDGFYTGETDPAIIGFNADPDGDGIKNSVEHAFALDPSESSSPALFTLTPGVGGILFAHKRNKTIGTDVDLTYQWSNDLSEWTEPGFFLGTEAVNVVVDSVDTTNVEYDVVSGRAVITAGDPKKFFIRAKVSND